VNVGPGSFTGIRASLALVFGLSMSGKPKIIPFTSFDMFEYNEVSGNRLHVVAGFSNFVYVKYMDGKKVAYINGVSIKKNHRGKHLSPMMLNFLHEHLKKEGFAFSFLKPAIQNYYEKFGYKTVIKEKKFTIEYKDTENYSATNYGYTEIFENISRLYEISLPRSKKRFEKIIRLYENYDGGIICFERNKQPLGYAIFAKEDEKTVIEETMFYSNDDYDILGNYFKQAEINELAVMVKPLNEEFNYTSAFIKVI